MPLTTLKYSGETTVTQPPAEYGLTSLQFTTPAMEEEGPIRAFSEELGKGILRGFTNVGAGIVGTAEWAIPGKQQFLLTAKRRIKATQEKFPMTHKGAAAWAGRVLGEAIPYMGASLAAAYGAAGVAGALTPTIAGAAGAGGGLGGAAAAAMTTKGATTIAPIVGSAMIGFAVEGDLAYEEAKSKGATEKQAQLDRVIVGTINAAIEALQINRLMKFHQSGSHSIKSLVQLTRNKAWAALKKEGKDFGADVLKTALTEGLEEFLQEGVSVGTPALLRGEYPKTASGQPDLWEIGQRLGGAALGGAFAGAVFGVAGAGLLAGPDIAAPTTEEISTVRQQVIDSKMDDLQKTSVLQELDKLEGKKVEVTEVPQTELTAVREKLKSSVETIEALRPEEQETMREELGKRFTKAEQIYNKIENPVTAMAVARGALKGSLKLEFAPLSNQFNESEIHTLFKDIQTQLAPFTTQGDAWDGLHKLIFDGKIPAQHEIQAMNEIFGTDISKALIEKRREFGKGKWDWLVNAVNLPRALLASYDISFPLRQGHLVLHADKKAWVKGLTAGYRAFFNPKYVKFVDTQIHTDPYFERFIKSGAELTRVGGLLQTEEAFMSEWSHKIPGIPASERAYVTAGNVMRFQMFKNYAQQWEGTGKTAKDYQDLGKLVNILTGRGSVKKLRKYIPMLNAMFFSPRLHLARFQTLSSLATVNSPSRKILAGTLVEFAGVGLGILTMLSMLPGVDVEKDPRSTDFGKVRIGNTRIDFFGDYQQITRLITRVFTGELKTADTKHIVAADRGRTILRFLQSKLSPAAGLTVDLLRGETFLGKQLKMEPAFITEQVYQRFAPLFMQDVLDAARYQGFGSVAIVAPLALHGVGAMTYPITTTGQTALLKDSSAKKYFGVRWDEVGPEAQKLIREATPQIDLMEEQSRVERENFDFMTRIAEEENKAKRNVYKSLPKNVRNELDKLVIDIKGLSRYISNGWYLNDKLYNTYKDNTAKELSSILPKIISLPQWNTYSDELKKVIIEEVISRVKENVRSTITVKANYKDLTRLQ